MFTYTQNLITCLKKPTIASIIKLIVENTERITITFIEQFVQLDHSAIIVSSGVELGIFNRLIKKIDIH